MSKIMKMAALVLVLILAVGMAGSAVAATSNVTFNWQGNLGRHGFAFTPENTDLFQNFKDLMPGDTVQQEITVQNTWHNPVRIYLMANPEVEEQYKDFLSQLKLTVKSGNSEIFEAAASEQDGLAPTEKNPYGVLLGTFNKKGSVKLTATLEVPIELSSDYMGQYGEVPWTFTAEEVVLPDTPDTGDDFTLWVWVAVAGVLVISLLWLLLGRKKQKEA